LKNGWFEGPYDQKWISFLGRFAISFGRNNNYFLDIETTSLKPFQLRTKNNIPIFEFKHKEGEKNGKENDDRANSMNPNNPAYQASADNRYNQLNPNNLEYKDDEDK